MDQKTLLKIKIQRYLDNMKQEYPLLVKDYRQASLNEAVRMLWNERRFIGCTNVHEPEWKRIALNAFDKWLKENS